MKVSSTSMGPPLPTHLEQRAALEGLTNAVEHEPCSLLGNAERTSDFVAADSILDIGDEPDSGKPLLKSQRRVLEDGAHLGSELPFGMGAFALPFPLSRQEGHIGTPTGGASDPIRPTALSHVFQTVIGIGEVDNSFLEGTWRFHVQSISDMSDSSRILLPVQLIESNKLIYY
jgi:hypothetical protein